MSLKVLRFEHALANEGFVIEARKAYRVTAYQKKIVSSSGRNHRQTSILVSSLVKILVLLKKG